MAVLSGLGVYGALSGFGGGLIAASSAPAGRGDEGEGLRVFLGVGVGVGVGVGGGFGLAKLVIGVVGESLTPFVSLGKQS